jgi:hypothetical protein
LREEQAVPPISMQAQSRGTPVYFYVPVGSWPEDLAPGAEYFWSRNRGGIWNWTVQTYEHLKRAGADCSLVTELPREGIVIAHRKLFPLRLKPSPRQLIVCIEADQGRMPFAQLHVQQNPVGALLANHGWLGRLERVLLGQCTNHFIYFWSQPGLVPRNPARGNIFRRVVFQGRARHLIPELRGDDFKQELGEMGLEFVPQFAKELWNDYSEVDAVVAIRDSQGLRHVRKPATKLYNAWHAGVPAILNPESAYLAESDRDADGVPLDFIPARTRDEVVIALRRLAASQELREDLVARGLQKASRTSTDNIVRMWIGFLQSCAIPMFDTWTRLSEHRRRQFFALRELHFWLDQSRQRIERRLSKWAGIQLRERSAYVTTTSPDTDGG